jgi:uncharacterized membrane protein
LPKPRRETEAQKDNTTMNEDTPDVRFNRRFIAYFAVGLCLAAMSYIGAITFVSFPKDNAQYANTVLGFIMGTVMASPIAFFFGSSKSSQAKDQMIASALPLPDPPREPPANP